MKLSKSILYPIRATRNGAAVSLSFLRLTNKSGAQPSSSHCYTSVAAPKKRGGGASENPDPSSPKVTCIGQVRVKSKKKSMQQCRSLSSRRRTGGEASFRKTEQDSIRFRNKHQRWVHLPTSACEALRSFGAEFSSCLLFPCRKNGSFVRDNNKDGDDVIKRGCCRWLVCANEGGRRGKIEVVVGCGDAAEEEEDEEEMMCEGSLRRHVFEDFEVKNGVIEVKGRRLEVEEEGTRFSICIPPKNALLLMRCRSDPMKMAALVNRCSWECQNHLDIQEEEEEENAEFEEINCDNIQFVNEEAQVFEENEIIEISVQEKLNLETYEDKLVDNGDDEKEQLEINDDDEEEEEEEEIESNMSSFEALLDQEGGDVKVKEEATNDVVSLPEKEEEETEVYEEDDDEKETFQKNQETLLPDCLLLMMCEPKLSMEVSKETWVRSTDFIRWLPDRPSKTAAGCDHHKVVKRRPSVDSKPRPPGIPVPPARKNDHRIQPPRSSCTLPAASVATMIERKLQGAYGPLALKRCKSEPMRTAAAKLLPESCNWKNGVVQAEPHGRAALGAAGVGF
ncbi:hypothetical protein CASFOL_024427 [Castilleja foliolosa]|uniref:Uncharacterized protein n=1 Tax=Castilleja foliolosa TaxID=1961234 RepID=A0ABD3CP68_9LAMI